MKKLVFLVTLFAFVSMAYATETISWQDASKYYGKQATVEGTVVSTKCTAKVCYLNFDKNWKKNLTAVIFANSLTKFPATPDKYYLNKTVKISGVIKENKGKPEVILNDPKQIEEVKTVTK